MNKRKSKSPLTHIEIVKVAESLRLMADENKHIDLWVSEVASKLSDVLDRDMPITAPQARKAMVDFGYTFKLREQGGPRVTGSVNGVVEDHNVAELVKRLTRIERKLDLIANQVEVPEWVWPGEDHEKAS